MHERCPPPGSTPVEAVRVFAQRSSQCVGVVCQHGVEHRILAGKSGGEEGRGVGSPGPTLLVVELGAGAGPTLLVVELGAEPPPPTPTLTVVDFYWRPQGSTASRVWLWPPPNSNSSRVLLAARALYY